MFFLWQKIHLKRWPYQTCQNPYRRKTISLHVLQLCCSSKRKFENTYWKISWWQFLNLLQSLINFDKFLFCSVTNLAQNPLLVLFATNHFHVMLMLSDISESILAKNPLFANTVHMQQIIKEIWKNIFLKCIKKMLNLL